MVQYTVHLPDCDLHLHGQKFFDAIIQLSNETDDEGRPIYVTEDLAAAMKVVHLAYLVCRTFSLDTAFNIRITPLEVQPNV